MTKMTPQTLRRFLAWLVDLAVLSKLLEMLKARQKKGTVYGWGPSARRYLRRVCGGDWHRGANHVARYYYGLGIGWDPRQGGFHLLNLRAAGVEG